MSRVLPFDLPQLANLKQFAADNSGQVDDEAVLRFFTESGYCPAVIGCDAQAAERWNGIAAKERQSILEKLLIGFLEVARQPRQSLLLGD